MTLKRIVALILAVITCAVLCLSSSAAADSGKEITLLFTHDLHSHLLPAANESGDGEYGGYARLMTAINAQKSTAPDAILVDAGDFSMGSLFQTAYPTSAIELRMMGAMGYDATTFGNHEYDYLQSGLKSMLRAAVASGDPLPAIVCGNYLPPVEGQEGYDAELWAAYNDYGVKDYIIIERGGVYYVIFGIFGEDADACAPNSGMVYEEPVDVAKEIVSAAVSECEQTYGAHPVVVCLSHSGTSDGKGEDYDLARKVDGIDVIVSGHTHTTLAEPISVNGTLIVSAAEYGRNLGVLKLRFDGDRVSLAEYKLVAIDENMGEDATVSKLVESYKKLVEDDYLSAYGYSFDQVLVNNPYTFDTVSQVYATQHESTLCNVFSDAYKWAVERAVGKKVDVAVILGATVMRHDVCWRLTGKGEGRTFDSMLPTIAKAAREITEYAAARGVRTCSENHGYIAQDSDRVERLVNAVAHDNYGVLVDMGNFACADEDSAMAVSRLAPLAFHAHAKDFTKRSFYEGPARGYFQTRACNYLKGEAVGEGDIPVKQCIAILKRAGYDGFLSIEYEGSGDCIEGIKAGFANLTRFLAELA